MTIMLIQSSDSSPR